MMAWREGNGGRRPLRGNRRLALLSAPAAAVGVLLASALSGNCLGAGNVYGLATLQTLLLEEPRPIPAGLYEDRACAGSAYMRTRWLLSQGGVQEALDFVMSEGTGASRPMTFYPEFFRSGLAARRAGANGRWPEAVRAYRQMFGQANQARADLVLDDVMAEYRFALTSAYGARRDELAPEEQLRWALWLWRSGRHDAAERILDDVAVGSRSLKLPRRVIDYRTAIAADRLIAEARYREGVDLLRGIDEVNSPATLRVLVNLASSTAVGSDSVWARELEAWPPAMYVKDSDGRNSSLGITLLEPEVIPDGGEACMVLFGEDETSLVPLRRNDVIELGDGRWLREVCTRNLVQNPGFEWGNAPTTTRLPGDYLSLYDVDGNQPLFLEMSRDGMHTYAVCLTNPEGGRHRSGVQQVGPRVDTSSRYLVAMRARTEGPTQALLIGTWLEVNTSSPFRAGSARGATWQLAGGVVSPSPSATGSVLQVVNFETVGTVCVDDLLMLRLSES